MSKICFLGAKRPTLRDYLFDTTSWNIDFLAYEFKKKIAMLQ